MEFSDYISLITLVLMAIELGFNLGNKRSNRPRPRIRLLQLK